MYNFQQRAYPCYSADVVEIGQPDEPVISQNSYAFQFFDSETELEDLQFLKGNPLRKQKGIQNVGQYTIIGKYITDPNCDEFRTYCLFHKRAVLKKNFYISIKQHDYYVVRSVNDIKDEPFYLISEEEAAKYIKSWDEILKIGFVNWYY
jgi:hypothetical protein